MIDGHTLFLVLSNGVIILMRLWNSLWNLLGCVFLSISPKDGLSANTLKWASAAAANLKHSFHFKSLAILGCGLFSHIRFKYNVNPWIGVIWIILACSSCFLLALFISACQICVGLFLSSCSNPETAVAPECTAQSLDCVRPSKWNMNPAVEPGFQSRYCWFTCKEKSDFMRPGGEGNVGNDSKYAAAP